MTNGARQRLVRMETRASFPFFIKINYENANGVEVTERYVNADEEKVYNNETYQPACFSVKPPSKSNSTVTDGSLTLSTIDQTWITKVRSTQKRMKCTVVACIIYDGANNEEIEGIEESSYLMVKAKWNESTMSFSLMFDDRMNLTVPMDVANSMKVAGME